MFQTHCYDAWLGGAARDSRFAMWSQLGGTFPAPLFLFLAGISVALIAEKMLQKGSTASQVGKKIIFRGTEILGLGLLFRVQEYAISWGWAPWTDLFRVDILNTIGVSIILMGAVCWIALLFTRVPRVEGVQAQENGDQARLDVRRHTEMAAVALIAAVVISLLTPLLWTTWRPRLLPWQLESYINGVHNLGAPQPWLFPIFPWTGFAFAGLSVGSILASGFSKKLGSRIFLLTGVSGVALVYAARLSDSLSWQIYPVYDYWHTSPSFFLLRVGMLLILVLGAYAWCRWGMGQIGFSPLIQLGKTSLLVYWVHIELVYGRFHILAPRSQTILGASKGLLTIFLAMLALSLVRTAWKARTASQFRGRKPAQAAG
jgi:uncharacterized membrane protein